MHHVRRFFEVFAVIVALMCFAPRANAEYSCTARANITEDWVERCDGLGAADCMLMEWNSRGCKCICAGDCTGAFVPQGWERGFHPQTCKWNSKNNTCMDDLRTDNPYEMLLEEVRRMDLDIIKIRTCNVSCKAQALGSCKSKPGNAPQPAPVPVLVPEPVPVVIPVNPYTTNPDFKTCFPKFGPETVLGGKIILIGYCCYKAGAIAAGFFVANVPGAAVGAVCTP